MNSGAPPSLLGVTVRRSFSTGRFFLGYGTAISVVLGVSLALSQGSAFATTFPFLLPIFVVVGSMGAMVVFTNDRIKGVLEYLLAYGYSPRRLFVTFLLTALALSSIVLSVAVAVGLGLYLIRGHTLTSQLETLMVVYAIPMSFASSAFAATVGMLWTSLSSPRAGMNSPIGLIPLIGILPSIVTLFLLTTLAAVGVFSPTELLLTATGVVGAAVLLVVALLGTLRWS
ncbi:MAG: hypothetical protein L3K02_06795, partial [Thermoplasmata archaeon]|nr:hypothetical protein [Thermoplasmata archaeon]